MKLRLSRPAFILSALLAISAAADDRGLPRPVVPEGFGTNIHFTDPSPGEMARFAEAGYRFARMDFTWEAVERQRGRYDFSAYERLMSHLKRAGARPIFILDYGNRLYDRGEAPSSDSARAAFARYAAAAARHFHGQGIIWEIWNEPNIGFWKPRPNAQDYAKLALETARAIRAADPQAVIVTPGSSAFPWDFFETIFAAGLLEHIDAVSVHPYRESAPETAGADYGRLRALIARHAPPERMNLPIISSEWGYSTAVGAVSESRQAQYLARQWLANLAHGVNLSIFYDWRDDGDNARDREHRFGTVRRDLEPKPSFLAAQKLIRTLNGHAFRHRLEASDHSAWKLLFENSNKPGELTLVEWSADPSAGEAVRTPRYHAVTPESPEGRRLRRLARVQFPSGPLAEKTGHPPVLPITVSNTEPEPATIQLTATGDDAPPVHASLTIQPADRVNRALELPVPGLRTEHRSVRLEIAWNDEQLPVVAPLKVWRADPLSINEAPRADKLEVVLTNPGRTSFAGNLRIRAGGRESEGNAVRLRSGEDTARVLLPIAGEAHQIALRDEAGALVALTPATRFERMAGFPAARRLGLDAEMVSILFIDNRAQAQTPLKVVAAGPDAPAPEALEVPYHFDPGWRYLGVSFREVARIPSEARAAVVWVRGNHSGDALRSRFRDATGQTFQVNLARLDWSGWRPLRIDFAVPSGAGHWGGANDGKPHRPLTWEAPLLIDSARGQHPKPQTILAASPFYVMDR